MRFYVPGQVGFAVFAQHLVGADGVEVFGIDEESIHVEEAGADRGEGTALALGLWHQLVSVVAFWFGGWDEIYSAIVDAIQARYG